MSPVFSESCKKKDILEYQVATLEEKLKKADSLREEVAKLEIENEVSVTYISVSYTHLTLPTNREV